MITISYQKIVSCRAILKKKGIVSQPRQVASSPKRDTADKLAAEFLGVFEPDQEHDHVPAARPPGASADLLRASIAENTRRAYETALRRFEKSEYPETDGGIAAYLSSLYEQGRSAACAAMLVAALRFRARLRGLPSPVGAVAQRVLAGFRRLAYGRGRGKVTGVRWEQADRAAAMAERPGDLTGLRDAAIVAVASDALLRVSEIAALDVSDINLAEQTVLIRRSKTDQEGKGTVQYLGKPTTERIQAWLLNSGLAEGPLFRAVNKGGRVRARRLTDRTIRVIITQRAKAAGVDGRVSGHSLRVGSAQSLANAGASLVEMQVAGRWRSPAMPGLYAQGQLAKQGAVARLRYGDEFDLVQRGAKRTRRRLRVNSRPCRS